MDTKFYGGKVVLRFDPERHTYYRVDGASPVRVPNATTILSILDRPALKQWAANQCAEAFPTAWDVESPKTVEEVPAWLESTSRTARYAWKRTSQTALDIGSAAHNAIEKLIRDNLGATITKATPVPRVEMPTASQADRDAAQNCVRAAHAWMHGVEFRPIATEQKIYSWLYDYCGTMDTKGWVEDKLTIIDWKSSKAIYDEYYYQLAAYLMADAEMTGEPAVQRIVCQLGKTSGKFNPVTRSATHQHADFMVFLGALFLYRRLGYGK